LLVALVLSFAAYESHALTTTTRTTPAAAAVAAAAAVVVIVADRGRTATAYLLSWVNCLHK